MSISMILSPIFPPLSLNFLTLSITLSTSKPLNLHQVVRIEPENRKGSGNMQGRTARSSPSTGYNMEPDLISGKDF